MSKFLKFIVHFIVICTIVCVVGLAVPPFLGITTEIMDDSGKETNLPMGSVTYAIPVKIKEAAVGDSILYQTDSKAYRYMITEMDKKNHIFKVIDSSDKDAEPAAVVEDDDDKAADSSEDFWAKDESQLKLDPPPAPPADFKPDEPDYDAFQGVKFSE